MAHVLNEVRRGFYLDSVALMRMSRAIAGMDGVEEAALMMGTPANHEIMADARLLADAGKTAGGGDLLIGIRATSQPVAEAALAEATALLDAPATRGDGAAYRPKSLRAAVGMLPGANLALISVPGDFAVAEARKAIRRGLNAMIFSDNVDIEAEAALKAEARELGRLVMGPDCGTAIIAGTPLAFTNVVPRGSIGMIGASGTGLQEVTCLVAQHGGGISHAIGVGGRDLKAEVGGISTLMAIEALAADPGTDSIVLIAKPPAGDVAKAVLEALEIGGKPAVICFMGAAEMELPENVRQCFSLKNTAFAALGEKPTTPAPPSMQASDSEEILGLFAGGTLCAEAQVILRDAGQTVRSNAPVTGISTQDGDGHLMLDLGDDDYTRGRPHPMIDPTVRNDAFIDALARTDLAAILCDVVIGYGAHGDPAGHLVALVSAHGTDTSPVLITSVCGTDGDPQGRAGQIAKLEEAGIHVAPSNADAAKWALAAIGAG